MKPALAHRRVVVTRAAAQAGPWLAALTAAGAEAIALPTIAIAPPVDPTPLDAALHRLASFDGFLFTSANGVRGLLERGTQLGLALRRQASSWIAAVGPATAAALPADWSPTYIATEHRADGLLAALAPVELRGQHLLLPRAAAADDQLPRALQARGAAVTAVTAYHTILPATSVALAMELFPAQPGATSVDAVIFTSGSTADNLAALLGSDYRQRLGGVALGAIGPVTAAALERLGLRVAFEAPDTSAAGLCAALRSYWHA